MVHRSMLLFLPLAIVSLLQLPQRADRLAEAILDLPDTKLTRATAQEHAWAAVLVETPDMPAEILLALAWSESKFSPTAGPHGHWVDDPAKMLRIKRKHYICGPVQTMEPTAQACLEVRDPFVGYARGIVELTYWSRRCRGSASCALRGHARGGRAARGLCAGLGTAQAIEHCRWAGPYAERVLTRARKLRDHGTEGRNIAAG